MQAPLAEGSSDWGEGKADMKVVTARLHKKGEETRLMDPPYSLATDPTATAGTRAGERRAGVTWFRSVLPALSAASLTSSHISPFSPPSNKLGTSPAFSLPRTPHQAAVSAELAGVRRW